MTNVIDTNVYLSRWPTRRLPCDELPPLIDKLKAKEVAQAWVGSFDALLHKDIGGVNARLAEECKRRGDVLLVPFGSVNPTLPDWEEDLRRCQEVFRMPGIRLHPNYHGYKLDDPRFARLLDLAAERGLLVQLAVRMEDPRTQHALLTVPDVDPAPLIQLLPKHPQLRLQVLNAMTSLRPDLLDKLIAAGNLSVEIGMLEGVNGVQKLLAHVPPKRVLFGSYFPFYAWEAAELKLRESPLGEAQREAIRGSSARAVLSPA
jgi:predicted TIM-barrel fold metal-dependent hydrolase